jgi:hypothetical protein
MKATAREIEVHVATLCQTPLLIGSVAERLCEEQLRVRPLPDGWSLVDLLAHLHACAEIWGDDIERMLTLEAPRFSKPHPRQVMGSDRHQLPSFAESARAFAVRREQLIARLRTLEPDQWERGATINGRGHTVFTHTRRMALHEAVHAEQIRELRRVIAGREPGPV